MSFPLLFSSSNSFCINVFMTNKALWQGLIDVSVGIIPFHSHSHGSGWQHLLQMQTPECPWGCPPHSQSCLSCLGTSESPFKCHTLKAQTSEKLRAQKGIEALQLGKPEATAASPLNIQKFPGLGYSETLYLYLKTQHGSFRQPSPEGRDVLSGEGCCYLPSPSFITDFESLSSMRFHFSSSPLFLWFHRLSRCPQI